MLSYTLVSLLNTIQHIRIRQTRRLYERAVIPKIAGAA
jgi:hypothetical protein